MTSAAATMLAAGFVVFQAGCGQEVEDDPEAGIKAAGEEEHGELTPEQKKEAEKQKFKGQETETPK